MPATIGLTERSGLVPQVVGHYNKTPPWSDVFVQRLRSFVPLSDDEASALVSLVYDATAVGPYHEVFSDGIAAPSVTVLLSGLGCHYRQIDTTRRQMTGLVLPGCFCDHGFLSSSPVTQPVMTLGPTLIGFIDIEQFSALGSRMPNIVLAAMRAASVEQASGRELVISLGARDAVQRLAHLLCELMTRLHVVGLVNPAGQFDLAVTQAELGEVLGLSTVHVNRTIQQLRKQKLITMGQGRVTVLDFGKLSVLANFDAHYLKTH